MSTKEDLQEKIIKLLEDKVSKLELELFRERTNNEIVPFNIQPLQTYCSEKIEMQKHS